MVAISPVRAGNGDCAQPVSADNSPTATDCFRILNVAVGLASCAPHADCVCAPKGTLPATATDSLRCLSAAVGDAIACDSDDLVVVVPYQQPAEVVRGLVEADTTITRVDAYLLLDRAAACFPIGTGTPPDLPGFLQNTKQARRDARGIVHGQNSGMSSGRALCEIFG